MNKKTFEEQIAEETYEPSVGAFKYVHSTLEIAWACARDIFGDLARPEHAFSIYDEMHACSGPTEDDACAFCEMPSDAHPGAVCRVFVKEGEGCDKCGQHEDSHLEGALQSVCSGFVRSADESECDHCGHTALCHPVSHGQDGVCYQFVVLGEGCDNCSQHVDAHGHSGRLEDVCPSYSKAEPS